MSTFILYKTRSEWGSLLACLLSGEGLEAVGFIYRHPEVSLNLAAFSIASAIGQVGMGFFL